MRMSRQKKASYDKGLALERRVASWLRRTYGFSCTTRDLVRGLAVKRPYEVDVHATITKGRIRKKEIDVWVECKALKVKRVHITKLITSAEDVRDAAEEGIAEWYPDILMIVSNKGFDIDAIGWADRTGIYCVEAGERSYRFVGEMTREDFEKLKPSDY